MGLLYLSFAVFAWGLGYKLALYKHVDGSTKLPEAKLLIVSEHTPKIDPSVLKATSPSASLSFASFLFLAALFLSSNVGAELRVLFLRLHFASAWKHRRFLFLNPLFFRPPPVQA
ncbi:MAG: hypothetical protein ACYC46_10410 [Acidobacteriaceae bacterium]